jgi:hypothetical protein
MVDKKKKKKHNTYLSSVFSIKFILIQEPCQVSKGIALHKFGPF